MACAEVLPQSMTQVGTLRFEYVSGTSGPVRITNALIGGVTPTEGPPPRPTWWKPNADDLKDRSAAFSVPIFKFTDYQDPTERIFCDGPLEYTVCAYRTVSRFVANGTRLGESDSGAARTDVTKHISGICPGELIKLLLSLGTSAIPKPSLSTVSYLPTEAQKVIVEQIERVAQSAGDLESIAPTVSRAAFDSIAAQFGKRTGVSVRSSQVTKAFAANRASLSVVARELRRARGPARTLGDVFDRLAATELQTDDPEISPDEAWVNAAALIIAD